MKLPRRQFLHLAAGAAALPAVRMARARSVVLLTCSALLSGLPGLPAHADSNAAAEFTLKICSDAMEDFGKIEAAGRDAGWTVQPISSTMGKYVRARSMWRVPQGDETYVVSIWEHFIGEEQKLSPRKSCSVSFPNKTVRRDEFFNLMSAVMDLTFASDTRMPQMRIETYGINRYRPNKVNLTFTSTLDGIVTTVLMHEMLTFALPKAGPATAPAVDR